MVFVFISAMSRDLLGFTVDEAGGNLPAAYAPWERLSAGGALPLNGSFDHVTIAIETQGYYLARVGDEEGAIPRRVH